MKNLLIVCIIMFLCSSVSLMADFAGGSGTESDPWQISTAEDLNNVRLYLGPSHSDKYFIQTSDINLGVSPWNEGEGWLPISFTEQGSQTFRGQYNGNGYKIKNLYINRPGRSFQSLFGRIAYSEVKNIGLTNVDIKGYDYTAGLVSDTYFSTVSSCFTTGNIIGLGYATGGLVAENHESTIFNCYSAANVYGYDTVGGLVGCNHMNPNNPIQGSVIIDCYAVGSVFSTGFLNGGLVGSNFWADVINSYYNSDICSFDESCAIGINTNQFVQSQQFQGWDISGISGSGAWTIIEGQSYPALNWGERTVFPLPGPTSLSANVSENTVTLSWQDSYLDSQNISGYRIYRDNELLNHENLINSYFFTDTSPLVWHYSKYTVTKVININGVERESVKSNFSEASVVQFSYGEGTSDNPYIIQNAVDLSRIEYSLDSCFLQTANIFINNGFLDRDTNWIPLGSTRLDSFTGSYDGGGFVIDGLTIDVRFPKAGLFKKISGGEISNLGITNISIKAPSNAGAISGFIENSVVFNCFSTGVITVESNLSGGLSGVLRTSQVDQCFSMVNHPNTAEYIFNIGGLFGLANSSSISNSYSTGYVFGRRSLGGFIGSGSNLHLENNYSTGYVLSNAGNAPSLYIGGFVGKSLSGTFAGNYWDIESSGQIDSAVGEGKTTQEMTQLNTFTGWNFNECWEINENITYPYLQGQTYSTLPIPGPGNFTVQAGTQSISLFWDDSGPTTAGYNVYRDGDLINSELITETTYHDNDVENFHFYYYVVKAVHEIDQSMIESLPSDRIEVSPVEFSGGYGTIENPYLLSSAFDINNIKFALNSHFKMTSDIDLDSWLTENYWEAIGKTSLTSFRGTFNGNGFTISNFDVNPQNTNGLISFFGYVNGAHIKNVSLTDIQIEGHVAVAGLIAYAENSVIVNCSVSGFISANRSSAGLVYRLSENSILKNCRSNVVITGLNTSVAAGLVSESNHSVIKNSTSRGQIDSGRIIGGLVGINSNSLIIDCHSSINITGSEGFQSGSNVGGLVADNISSTIEASYSTGNVTGCINTGGLVGKNSSSSLIANCFSTGIVHGRINNTGGLIGFIDGTSMVVNSYSTGLVEGSDTHIGGFIGRSYNSSIITNCYWDRITSEQTTSAGGYSRHTSEMTFPYLFQTYMDWDFQNIWHDDTQFTHNNGYPFLEITLDTDKEELPEIRKLTAENFPNPFNPFTYIKFSLPLESEVSLTIYNIRGQKVKTLIQQIMPAGTHSVTWDGTDQVNNHIATGFYFYKLQTSYGKIAGKMMLIK